MQANKHLKVVHIASGDLWAGAEAQLFTLAKTLQRYTETDVHVILMNHGMLEEKLLAENIPVTVLDEATLNPARLFAGIIKALRNITPDIVHTHRQKENILGSIAALFAGNIPSLRTVHGAPEHHPGWRQFPKRVVYTLDWLCGRFIQKKLIAVSEDLTGILKKDFPAERIVTIENGVDIEAIQQVVSNLPPRTRAPGGAFRVGLAGRLVPIKRVDMVIKTAKYLMDHHPDFNVSFHIMGDGPLRKELETLSQQLGTEGIIEFEGHCSDIVERLYRFDALLMTSDHEGLPMVLLESIALQLPVIAHNVGGIPKVIGNNCGLLADHQKAETYASLILELASSDKDAIRQLTESALNRINTGYSSNTNAVAIFEQYSG